MEEKKFGVVLFCLVFTIKDEPIYYAPDTIQETFTCRNSMPLSTLKPSPPSSRFSTIFLYLKLLRGAYRS